MPLGQINQVLTQRQLSVTHALMRRVRSQTAMHRNRLKPTQSYSLLPHPPHHRVSVRSQII